MKVTNNLTIRNWLFCATLLVSAPIIGWLTGSWAVAGVLAVAAVVMYWLPRSMPPRNSAVAPPRTANTSRESVPAVTTAKSTVPATAGDPEDLAERLIGLGRCALLLRPQIARGLSPAQLQRAGDEFDAMMSIVPEGYVLLEPWRDAADANSTEENQSRMVRVEAVYLDRYPVTNRQYQQFVDDGGYQEMALWESSIWPAVLDFVDATDEPGPRFWHNGRYEPKLADHPVVGVSWYEAAAYARWAGKRLPSDPEWVKAACWPVTAEGTRPIQRRYPWGNAMDRNRAHVWGAGNEGTIPVDTMPGGVSVGGAYQLIGNVWEWTTSDFGVWDAASRRLELATPMKSIRGGAFDTYFATQATCQFQSGESPIQRKRNIGFRCALSICDVVAIDAVSSNTTDQELDLVGVGEEA